jgi:uncharacterized protein YbjT (DUF2867 family)
MSHQSNKNVILVTGATGFVGMATIRALSNQKNVTVRALVKDDDKESKHIQELSNMSNVKVVHGNLNNTQKLDELLDGVNRALLVCPNVSDQIQLEKNFLQSAKKRQLDLLVKVSILSPMSMVSSESQVGFAKTHNEVEKLLKDSGLSHVILRPNFFFENLFWFRDEIHNSQSISVPCPDIPATMVAVEDVGRIAAQILVEQKNLDRFSGKAIDICGPESVSFQEIARRMSKRLGKDIKVKEIDSDTLVKNLKQIDLSEEMLKGLKPIFDEYWSKRAFDCQTKHEELPIEPSMKLDQWLEKHISCFSEESTR